MKTRIKTFFLILTALAVLMGSLILPSSAETLDVSTLYKKKDADDTWSVSDAQAIDLNGLQDGETLTISEKGDYVLSGTLRGQILIEVPEEDKVRLILNGVNITAQEGPAIYEKSADTLLVALAAGTENFLTDGAMVTDDDDTIGAALYAEDDLSINGAGSLTASGTQKHGIQSKADLVIANGQITVSAVLDGIRGRNSVLVLDGKISVTAGGDGITSTRTDAEGKGWIVLAGGEITVKTGDGAGAVRASANSRGGFGGGFGGRGRWDDWGRQTQTDDSGVSQKAVKAAADLTVLDGTYVFDCADDGLHGVSVTVNGGAFSILSGDDGMHADETMTVNGGTIGIAQCYEGLEGKNVTVNGGEISITASDDGVNASGGNDGSGFGGWGRGGGGFSEADNGGMLTITGGHISVTAGGDGLDSNGSILMSGGVVGVWTAANGMEGPIDFNGTGTISGGTLIVACNGGGMGGSAQLSGQAAMTLSVSGGAGETVTVLDGNGAELGTFTPGNAFGTLMISSDGLQEGGAFTVTAGSRTLYSGAMENNSNVYNGYGYGPGNGGGFGPGNGRHGRRGW